MKPPSEPLGDDIYVRTHDQFEQLAEFPGGRVWLRVSHLVGADFDKEAAIRTLLELNRRAWDVIAAMP